MMTDPIADALTRLRNAVAAGQQVVELPGSKMKEAILRILEREGFIKGYEVIAEKPQRKFRVQLKYGPAGEPVIHGLRRVSSPGRRIYRQAQNVRPVLNGLGHAILSTSNGLLTDSEARAKHVGGEIVCEIW